MRPMDAFISMPNTGHEKLGSNKEKVWPFLMEA